MLPLSQIFTINNAFFEDFFFWHSRLKSEMFTVEVNLCFSGFYNSPIGAQSI